MALWTIIDTIEERNPALVLRLSIHPHVLDEANCYLEAIVMFRTQFTLFLASGGEQAKVLMVDFNYVLARRNESMRQTRNVFCVTIKDESELWRLKRRNN